MNLILLELKEVVLLIYPHNVTDFSADTATISSLNEQRKFIVKIYIKAIICTMANAEGRQASSPTTTNCF
jgi:hypothetical protein